MKALLLLALVALAGCGERVILYSGAEGTCYEDPGYGDTAGTNQTSLTAYCYAPDGHLVCTYYVGTDGWGHPRAGGHWCATEAGVKGDG